MLGGPARGRADLAVQSMPVSLSHRVQQEMRLRMSHVPLQRSADRRAAGRCDDHSGIRACALEKKNATTPLSELAVW